jgi:capsular polysaccharide biosynthesis protein
MAGLGQEAQIRWPVFWSHHSDARLTGSTLLLHNEHRQAVVEAGYGSDFIKHDPGYWQFRFPPAVRLEGNWTSVVSRFSDGFPHWFLDALPRLALLSEFPSDTRVIVPSHLDAYHRDTLDWLGLTDRIRPTPERHLQVEHFFFGSMTNITGLFDPYAVEFCQRSFRHHADLAYDSPKRFFVHRVNVRRGLINEQEVIRFFQDRGWAIIDTQALTMAQQIQLFARAEHVCALHGAALANLLWSQPGCRVLELVPANFLNGVFEGLSEALGIDHSFLLCKGDADYKAWVDLDELRKRLNE